MTDRIISGRIASIDQHDGLAIITLHGGSIVALDASGLDTMWELDEVVHLQLTKKGKMGTFPVYEIAKPAAAAPEVPVESVPAEGDGTAG